MPSLLRDRAAVSAEMLDVFGDEALLAAALRFETAFAAAQAAAGLLSNVEAELVARCCVADGIDIASLAEAAAHAGTLAIPLVALLRARIADADPAAAARFHKGTTSQDLADTALMLQAKAGAALIRRDLRRLTDALAVLAANHAATKMLGRTLLQGALPITFGLKVANWLVAIDAAGGRFTRECDAALMLQLGGAAGTLVDLGGRGEAIARHTAATLGLSCPVLPWHSRRDGIAGLATALAIMTGAIGKIARDISLLAQNEVAEAREPLILGRGGSSAMAHKRNQTGCQIALSAALRAPGLAATILAGLPQEHERGLGGWQAEAPVLADLFGLAQGAILAITPAIEGLEVDESAMARNLAAAAAGADVGESGRLVAQALATRKGHR